MEPSTDWLGISAMITAAAGAVVAISGVFFNASKQRAAEDRAEAVEKRASELEDRAEALEKRGKECARELAHVRRKNGHLVEHLKYVDGLLTLAIDEAKLQAFHDRIANLSVSARPDWSHVLNPDDDEEREP